MLPSQTPLRVGGRLGAGLVSFLEALYPALPHTTLSPLSLPPSAWSSQTASRRNPARLRALRWGPACLGAFLLQSPAPRFRGWAAGVRPTSCARGKGLRPEAPGPSLHAQYLRAPDAAG